MFQYDSGRSSGVGVAPIIKDFGRSKQQISEYYQQMQQQVVSVWSLDGVEVAVDVRNQDAALAMATTGDALTGNTILVAGRMPRPVSADLFNSLRAAGHFDLPNTVGWKVGKVKRLTADTPYLNIAVLSVPTHDFKTWGPVSTAKRLQVLSTALRIAFTTWAADYRADSVYLFAAPEYYFGGTETHFLPDQEATKVTTALTEALQVLPDNYLVIPGSLGRRRSLTGAAAYEYYAEHLHRQEALLLEMTQHKLLNRDFITQKTLWGFEPKMVEGNSEQIAYVYSNTTPIFRGSTVPASYTKRYESDEEGKAPDRTLALNKDGYFDIGTTKFAAVVNGLTIRLEICADNTYDSIQGSGYNGLHVLLGSDFGRTDPVYMYGQVYAHVDSKSASVCAQRDPGVAQTRGAADERTMDDVDAQQTAAVKVGDALCQLTLHQRKL
jgi:hypothetical protein